MPDSNPSFDLLAQRGVPIEWILSDVDGVMTDGGVIMCADGEQIVRFHIHDGLGVGLWRRTGRRFGILTGRNLAAVRIRGEHLQADAIYQGADDKLATFESFLATYRVNAARVCYVGDDLPDLPILRRAGLAVTVPNAPAEVQAAAHYVTQHVGGSGAVRDVVETLLKAAGEWEEVVASYGR